jgi:hypothetical protein
MVDEAVAMAIYESATIGSQVKVKDVLDGKVETYQSDINAHWRL